MPQSGGIYAQILVIFETSFSSVKPKQRKKLRLGGVYSQFFINVGTEFFGDFFYRKKILI